MLRGGRNREGNKEEDVELRPYTRPFFGGSDGQPSEFILHA